jgi:hypothetical protein
LEFSHRLGRKSASAEREQNCIDAIEPVEELDADGACTFAGVEVFAVFDEKRIAVRRDLSGMLACIFDVSLDSSIVAPSRRMRGVGICSGPNF